ncbi:MAG TPA: HAMP domain-containing sensor histidine kinase, partial [Ktedonobacteraceae bacterium]|nr:HAMP domain-containing sensor histidine kinase [Ktedonobacteraceae bacterium]
MEERATDQHPQEPLLTLLQRFEEWWQHCVINTPWWRSAAIGYLVSPLLISIALLLTYVEQMFGVQPYISGGQYSLVAIVVALLWGIHPALFAVILGFITHYFFVIPLFGLHPFERWSDMVMYGPWLLGQLVVILIVAQRERAQQRALAAEHEARLHEKAEANHALAQSYQQLEQLNHQLEGEIQLKDIFVSRASHELKTPITTIRGQTQLILRRLAKSQSTASELRSLHPHLEKIDAQTHRLHTLIDDLLDMSSLNSGRNSLRLAPCDLGSLCQEIVEDQRTLSDHTIELDLPSDPIMLQADCQRLTQVIVNLITNAAKYSSENTVIHVYMTQDPSYVIFTVHNDGPAIPQEHQTRIFEPFYRTPEVEHSSVRGWGLGLSISKEIVERHEG